MKDVDTLDLSDRLRLLMVSNDLTVAELAAKAGVSKSAMEKYLAGPSSPRATAIASLYRTLKADPRWLLFGEMSLERPLLLQAARKVIFDLLHELREDADLSRRFVEGDVASQAFRHLCWDLAHAKATAVLGEWLEGMVANEGGYMTFGEPMPIFPGEEDVARKR